MKIAIVFQTERKQHKEYFTNGIQAVERMQAKILAAEGHKVTAIMTTDSAMIFDESINQVLIGGPSEESLGKKDGTKAEKSKLSKARGSAITAYIQGEQFDLVINHSFSSALIRMSVNLSRTCVPVITFIHCDPSHAFDISIFEKVNLYDQLTAAGGGVSCVSIYQRDQWRTAIKKHSNFNRLSPVEVDKIFSTVCGTCAITAPLSPVNPAEDYFIAIGRPKKDKKLGVLLKTLTELSIKPMVKIFMSFEGELTDHEYYLKNMLPYLTVLGPQVELHCNQPRAIIRETLSHARALILPSLIEAAAIVPIEALGTGVGTIVFCKETKTGAPSHSTLESVILPFSQPVIFTKAKFLDQFTEALQDPRFIQLKFRKAAQAQAETSHGWNVRSAELQALIQRYVRNKRHHLINF